MLTLTQASFDYGRQRALNEVSATVVAGCVVGLVGRNGSGKTTLLRLIAGLARPSTGRVEWNGVELHALVPLVRARQVAYVSGRPALSIDLTVSEVVALGNFAQPNRTLAQERVSRAIESVGLSDLQSIPFHQLSAGEQQRTVIARALAQHDSGGLLVLDEPFANLDPGESVRVARVLRGLALDGSLVIAAMHDLTFVDQCAQVVWWLERGMLHANGAASSVLEPSKLEAVFGCRFVRGTQGLTMDPTMMG